MRARKPQTSLHTVACATGVLVQAIELRHCKKVEIAAALSLLRASNPAIMLWLRDELAAALELRPTDDIIADVTRERDAALAREADLQEYDAQLAEVTRERDEIKHALDPKGALSGDHRGLVALAEAYRQDSEIVDKVTRERDKIQQDYGL